MHDKVQCEVLGLGQCSLDILGSLDRYPELDQKAELSELQVQGGGPTATALVTLARLGVRTLMVGAAGDDWAGCRIRDGLLDEGVDCRYFGLQPGASSQVAFIAVDAGGHRNIFWHRGTAVPVLPPVFAEVLKPARILHLDGLHLEPALAAARMARDLGVMTVLDAGTLRPGIEGLLPLIDHLVVSEKFARQCLERDDPGSALELLAGHGAEAVTVTLGKNGSLTRARSGELHRQQAFPVAAIDTTGCGDVFHGGYIYGLLQGWPMPRILQFAAACAALKTRALGGRTALPCLADVESFLAGRQATTGNP